MEPKSRQNFTFVSQPDPHHDDLSPVFNKDSQKSMVDSKEANIAYGWVNNSHIIGTDKDTVTVKYGTPFHYRGEGYRTSKLEKGAKLPRNFSNKVQENNPLQRKIEEVVQKGLSEPVSATALYKKSYRDKVRSGDL